MDVFERLLAEEGRRRAAAKSADYESKAAELASLLLPVQRRVMRDKNKRIAIRCPRRTGKTTTVRGRLLYRMLTKPNAQVLYVALTRPSAEELMWGGKSGLKAIDRKLGLNAEFHNAKLIMRLPQNGSTITLVGASTRDEIDKLRGLEPDEVWLDECKSYPPHILEELIKEAIEPSLLTRDGVLGMVGTPGNILSGQFYEITRPGATVAKPFDDLDPDAGDLWSFHTWTLADNTAEPHQWTRALKIKDRNGWGDTHPVWLREYLGQWAANDTDHVYRFRRYDDDGKPWNIWTPGPKSKHPFGLDPSRSWNFVYGMDLGAKDPFALSILAYADTGPPELFQVYEYTSPVNARMTPTKVGELLAGLVERTGYPIAMVADCAALGLAFLEEIKTRFGLNVEAAPRSMNDKRSAIDVINGDLIDGRLKLLPDSKAVEQMLNLQWDETGNHENKAQRNDACDALLYARGKCLHHLADPLPDEEPAPGSDEAIDAALAEAEAAAAGLTDDAVPDGISDLDRFLGNL